MQDQDLGEIPMLKVSIPSFLLKTYEILENTKLSHIIKWNEEGNAFIVYNTADLSSKVLANYFKHKNYPSFLRQLNMYNFKKSKNAQGQSEFRHKWFRRGLKSMLQYIRRRNQDEHETRVEIKDKNQELDQYKRDHENMRDSIKNILNLQNKMSRDLEASLEQNSLVQRQNRSILQQFKSAQQQGDKKFDTISMMLAKVIQSSDSLYNHLGSIMKGVIMPEEPLPFDIKSEYSYNCLPNENIQGGQSPYYQYLQPSPVHWMIDKPKPQIEQKFDAAYLIQLFQQTNRSLFKQPQYSAPMLALQPPPCYSYQPSLHNSCMGSQYGASRSNSPFRITGDFIFANKDEDQEQYN